MLTWATGTYQHLRILGSDEISLQTNSYFRYALQMLRS